MSSNWIVVANASRARILEAAAVGGELREIDTLVHPASRQHEGDLVADRSGHALSAISGGHSMGHEDAARQREAEVFARAVCERLEQGHERDEYRKFFLVAAPRFLGLLHRFQPRSLRGLVGGEVAKDLTMANVQQIRASLN